MQSLPNSVYVDPKATGGNNPKSVVVYPAPNTKPLTDNSEGFASGAAGAGVNGDGTPVLKENL